MTKHDLLHIKGNELITQPVSLVINEKIGYPRYKWDNIQHDINMLHDAGVFQIV